MDSADAMMQAFETSAEDCATTVIGPDSNGTLRFSQTYDVKVPKASGKIVLDASSVKKIKNLCAQAKNSKFPFAEVFLGVASLLLGAFLGALIAKVPYELNFASVLSYNICPVGGIGCGVAYFFCRHNESTDVVRLATQIDECIQYSDGVENEE